MSRKQEWSLKVEDNGDLVLKCSLGKYAESVRLVNGQDELRWGLADSIRYMRKLSHASPKWYSRARARVRASL